MDAETVNLQNSYLELQLRDNLDCEIWAALPDDFCVQARDSIFGTKAPIRGGGLCAILHNAIVRAWGAGLLKPERAAAEAAEALVVHDAKRRRLEVQKKTLEMLQQLALRQEA